MSSYTMMVCDFCADESRDYMHEASTVDVHICQKCVASLFKQDNPHKEADYRASNAWFI